MTVIIIHGNGHSTQQDNWIPYLKRELEKLQITVVVPQFSDAYLARALWWLLLLEHDLHADDQTIVVGYSSGALAAMRFAEHHIDITMFHEFNIVTGNADKIKVAISQRLVEILDKYLKNKE